MTKERVFIDVCDAIEEVLEERKALAERMARANNALNANNDFFDDLKRDLKNRVNVALAKLC